MKRMLFFLLLILGLRAPLTIEPVYSLTAFAYSISTLCSDKEWSGCIEDCPCDIDIIISKDTVKVLSQEPQVFSVLKLSEPELLQDGTAEIVAKAIDQDGDRCVLRFVHEPSDCWRLKVEYGNIRWGYRISFR